MLGGVGEYDAPLKGFWHVPQGTLTSEAIALEIWTRETHAVLIDVAGSYHATIQDVALAAALQERSGIATSRPPEAWLLKILAPLAQLCYRSGEPPLTALVVDRHGWVGDAYDEALRAEDQRPIEDWNTRERHAARARLECYQWAGSAPADGGVPASVRVATASGRPRVERAARASYTTASGTRPARAAKPPKAPTPKRVAASDKPIKVCPTCFMALPATGVCDNCD